MRLPFCKFIINKWYDTKMRDEGAIIAGSCCDIDWGKFYKDDKYNCRSACELAVTASDT